MADRFPGWVRYSGVGSNWRRDAGLAFLGTGSTASTARARGEF